MDEARSALSAFIIERRMEFNSRNMEIEEENSFTLTSAYRIMWRNPANWERLVEGLHLAGLNNSGDLVLPTR